MRAMRHRRGGVSPVPASLLLLRAIASFFIPALLAHHPVLGAEVVAADPEAVDLAPVAGEPQPAPAWRDKAPLTAEQRALLKAPRGEGSYRVRSHFLWSNEQRHDLFFDRIRGLGGGYLGVGADQNYTLAAVAAAEMVWLIDLDPAVVLLHRL